MEAPSLKVATLNFSGINTNPYEFNDGSPLFQQLNENYILLQKVDFPELKKWVGGRLDKRFKSNRLTVLFGDELIENLGGSLLPKGRFE